MSLRWSLRLHDAAMVQSIERESGVSPVIAQLLALRGISRRRRPLNHSSI